VGGRLLLVGRGRDLRTGVDGAATVLAEASMEVTTTSLAGGRLVERLETVPPVPGSAALLGRRAGPGFRGALAALDPDLARDGSLLGVLLDEVPVAALISGSSAHRMGVTPPPPPATGGTPVAPRRAVRVDTCIGWAAGSVMNRRIDAGLRPMMGEGPWAPPLRRDDDPIAWHDLDELPPGAMRRHRRFDLVAEDGLVRVESLFRDVAVERDGQPYVVHEYGVHARVDPATATVVEIRAEPHALPGPDCPGAAASAQRLVGRPLAEIRREVRDTFDGITTCTHLNDELRAFGDVHALLGAVLQP
jgi:hypothetical protein